MQEIKIKKYEQRIQGHGYKDTRLQEYKDTRMQGYKITKIKGYTRIKDTRIKTKSNNGSKIDTKK